MVRIIVNYTFILYKFSIICLIVYYMEGIARSIYLVSTKMKAQLKTMINTYIKKYYKVLF
jgi:hypothetical protein